MVSEGQRHLVELRLHLEVGVLPEGEDLMLLVKVKELRGAYISHQCK